METLLKNSTMEMLKEYYYDERGEYPPKDFTREEIISIILKAKQINILENEKGPGMITGLF